MGLLSKLRGRQEPADVEAASTRCPHTTTTPRWDNAEDVGHLDRATRFRCESCGELFGAKASSGSA